MTVTPQKIKSALISKTPDEELAEIIKEHGAEWIVLHVMAREIHESNLRFSTKAYLINMLKQKWEG